MRQRVRLNLFELQMLGGEESFAPVDAAADAEAAAAEAAAVEKLLRLRSVQRGVGCVCHPRLSRWTPLECRQCHIILTRV